MTGAPSGLRRLAGRCLRAVPPVRRLVYRRRARAVAARIDPADPASVPVLVYQMSKVGSSAVLRSLGRALERPVLQVHSLVPGRLAEARAYHARALGRPAPERYVWMLAEALGARVAELGDRVRFPVVTLVRDPIAREISSVFQDPTLFAGELRDARGRIDVSRTLAFLHARFASPDPCGYAEQWFDRELATSLGIDVFDEPFDRDRGYQIVRARRADLLILRTEDLDRTLPPGAAELLGVELPAVDRANERDRSPDADAYRRVREAFRLPRETVERIYAGRLARHFYGKDWRERFVARWSEKAQGRIA